MDENELKTLASSKGFDPIILEKDYYLTQILEGISRSNISKNLIFRGGTALNKLYFGYYHLSEDIDFILINVKKYSLIQKEIRNLCKDIGLNHKDSIFSMRNFVDNFNFIGPLNIPNTIKIDVNYDEKPMLNTEYKQVKHIFKRRLMHKPQLLSPVQDFVSLKAAINAKADAIYFGIKELNMRTKAKNFELKDTKKVIGQCHKNKVKAYFTLNTIIYDNEINKIRKILKILKKESIDAIIAWDFSVIRECENLNLPVHLSTQASISNFQAIKILKNKFKNIKRINLARELSLKQIKDIINQIKNNKLNIEIETFIHGAMCVSVSGRCFLSQEIFNKSANRGECLQPCRRKYIIKDVEEGHELELGEDYIISPKDLCTIEIIDKLMKAKIDAFKIEGRNRSPEYVKIVTECYRRAIDNPKADKKRLVKKLKTVYNRGFSTGFYLGKPVNEWAKAYGSKATKKKIYLGKVLNYYKRVKVAEVLLETTDLRLNDGIMFQGNKTGVVEQKVTSMEIKNKKITRAKKGQRVGIKTNNLVRENDKVFLLR